MLPSEDKILAKVQELEGELVALCRRLVRIPTVNPYSGDSTAGSEKAGQLFLRPILKRLGGSIARTRCFDTPPDIYERMGVLGPKNRNFKDRPNLVAEFNFGRPGPQIILNGHMDTVGAAGMEFDPFAAELRGGKIFGRGASDCKGGLSTGVIAIKALMPFKKYLSGRIIYESTVDEECNGGGAGTMACCLAGYKGDAGISLDGHDLINVFAGPERTCSYGAGKNAVTRACNGCLTANVHVQGKAGHAAKAGANVFAFGKNAVSALEKALVVKRAIDRLKRSRESRRPDARLNIGVFNSGVHPAVVPGSAFMSMNIVYELDEAGRAEKRGKGWGAAEIREAFERIVRQAEKQDPWLAEHPSEIEWVKDLMPFDVPADAQVVKDVCAAYERVTGRPAKVDLLVAWTDVCYLPRCAQTPAVMFGAGVTGKSHAADECVTVENLVAAAKVIALYLWRQLAAQRR